MTIGTLRKWFEERRRRREWSAERQLHELRAIVAMDHRWLAHDKTADALTHRYLKLLDEAWYKQTTENVRQLRERLGLCPHAARAHSEGRIYTQADLLEAVKTERHACSICVWMVLQDALEPGADDKGLDGWMREAEQRVKSRLAHHRTEAHPVEHGLGA